RDALGPAIGDVNTLARCTVVGPTVEGAADALALDLSTDRQVRPEVGAVGVDQTGVATVGSIQDEISLKVMERANLPGVQLGGRCHDEPPVGYRKRETVGDSPYREAAGRRVEQSQVA